ncbi:hypothetical protein [Schaedlerella sp.]|nr:hypothetical protein [uncultured Schaedlerella sp.]
MALKDLSTGPEGFQWVMLPLLSILLIADPHQQNLPKSFALAL